MQIEQTLGQLTTRSKIEAFEQLCSDLPQLDLEKETTHLFGGGMYARMLARPKGSIIIGKVHKKEHLYFVMSGSVLVTTDGEPVKYDAPAMVVGKVGTKRAVLALEDSVCVMIVKTDLTSVNDELEKELVEDDPYARYDINNKIIDKRITFGEELCQ